MTYEELLEKTAIENDNIVVMTAENRALVRNLPQKLGNRFIDTGITEQTMIGAAAGLALRGRIPIVHALSAFLTMRAFEFIRTSVGIPGLPVKLSSFIPGFLSDGNGPTHQAIEDIGIMRGIPTMEVFAPSDENDLIQMLPQIWNSPNPSYVRIHTEQGSYQHEPFQIGKSEWCFKGKDATILTYGIMFKYALEVRDDFLKKGVEIGLVNIRSLKPFDTDMINQLVLQTDRIITIEDHFEVGGLFSILSEYLVKNSIYKIVHPISLGNNWFKPGRLNEVIAYANMNTNGLVNQIEKFLSKK
jgi:transketolase